MYILYSTICNANIQCGEALFFKYGSNIRYIIAILRDEDNEAEYNQYVQSGTINIAKNFMTVLMKLEHLDFKSELFSKIFAVRLKEKTLLS